jgi:hypothetical protein
LKKLHFDQKQQLVRRGRQEMQRRKSIKTEIFGAKYPEKPLSAAPERKGSVYWDGVSRKVTIKGSPREVPSVLSLRNNWDETANFLVSVRSSLSDRIYTLRKRGRRRPDRKFRRSQALKIGNYLDFTTIESISIPVALILASEYDRSRRLIDWAPFAIDIEKWNPNVRRLLDDIGFMELAGVDQQSEEILQAEATTVLRLRCGHTVDGEAIGAYMAMLGVDLVEGDSRLFDAIMEAVTNIVHHAYRDESLLEQNSVKNWWLVAALTSETDGVQRLEVVVYDQGASIPRTLPSWDRYPLVRRKLAEFSNYVVGSSIDPTPEDARFDGDAIRLAIEVGRSSMGEEHRGKGLDQIMKALDLCISGTVAIYSRQGEFRQSKGEVARSINRSVPIIGTMVSWDLTIKAPGS